MYGVAVNSDSCFQVMLDKIYINTKKFSNFCRICKDVPPYVMHKLLCLSSLSFEGLSFPLEVFFSRKRVLNTVDDKRGNVRFEDYALSKVGSS